jgi:hypothetical protein
MKLSAQSPLIKLHKIGEASWLQPCFFEETVKCQVGKKEMEIEFGRSLFYGEDSIYLNVDGKGIVMDSATAKRFVEAVGFGRYFEFIE